MDSPFYDRGKMARFRGKRRELLDRRVSAANRQAFLTGWDDQELWEMKRAESPGETEARLSVVRSGLAQLKSTLLSR